ncbi:Protein FAM198A, partial [Cathartes aura]
PPWLSDDDLQKMRLLAGGRVVSKTRIPAHGQVLRVGLRAVGDAEGDTLPASPEGDCWDGRCGLIKRHLMSRSLEPFRLWRGEININDPRRARAREGSSTCQQCSQHLHSWLVRLLGLHLDTRSSLHLIPPQVQHRSTSVSQALVGSKVHNWTSLSQVPVPAKVPKCLPQVHDRLDRYCCGFQPDPSEPCMEEMLHEKCRNPAELVLVHILVRRSAPSRLVFIDNAGRPQHPEEKLNFRLLQGIDSFPAVAVATLRSGRLQSLLLESLRMDRERWESQGGAEGLRPLLRTIDRRARVLLRYIRERNLTV